METVPGPSDQHRLISSHHPRPVNLSNINDIAIAVAIPR